MGFLQLLIVAFMPPLEVLIIAGLGAFLATEYCGILTADARKNLNKVVFYVFTPCLMFGTLAKTMTLQEIISWWFMPVNIGIIFICGSILGWIVVKILKPERHLEGLIIACCSAGNLGNLMLIIVPAVCDENGSLFGAAEVCQNNGLAYASFSMALGGFYIWTHTYGLMRDAGTLYKKFLLVEEGARKIPNRDLEADGTGHLLRSDDREAPSDQEAPLLPSTIPYDDAGKQLISHCSSGEHVSGKKASCWDKIKGAVHQVAEELLAPPTVSAFAGFFVGSIPWLKSLIIGSDAPLRVIEDSIKLLGDGTIPCVTLILGGNLTKGIRGSKLRYSVIISIIFVRYVALPLIGIAVVKGVAELGLIPLDPLFQYTLMIQFTLPPAMNIGTMAELFSVGREECSVIFVWTYVVAALALTLWSTAYLWILA